MSKRKVYKELSSKLNKALSLLSDKYKILEIIELIKLKDNSLKRLSASYFSKYKNVINNDAYINSITEGTFIKILRGVDLILADDFRLKWNESIKSYEAIISNADEKHSIASTNNEKLLGLIGAWEGLSYNTKKSIKDKADYYSYFKLKILDKERVICNSLRANFNIGTIRLISIDRISIQISTTNRTIFLIGKIGLTENLEKLNFLNLAYADSGDQDVKHGTAVLYRSQEQYEKLSPEIISKDSPKIDKFVSHLNLIKDMQIIVPPSEE